MASPDTKAFENLVNELAMLARRPKEERNLPVHKARCADIEEKAILMLEGIDPEDIDEHLNIAQSSLSERLIAAFPSTNGKPYDFVNISLPVAEVASPSLIALLHDRGVYIHSQHGTLLQRAMKDNEVELRDLFLAKPALSSMILLRFALTIPRAVEHPDFFAHLLRKLVVQDQSDAPQALDYCCKYGAGFPIEYILRAGLPFEHIPSTITGAFAEHTEKGLAEITSNHRRLEMSYSHERLRDWLADREALEAADARFLA